MNIREILGGVENCPCGRSHKTGLKKVEISSGALFRTAELLHSVGFPTSLLLVTDKNEIRAASGITEILEKGGFDVITKLYDDMRCADMSLAKEIAFLASKTACNGILSVGTGSVNDICRYAAKIADKRFAIFATAPSMDGFASDTAPLTDGCFKISYKARQPEIIIADTKILAAAPAELKSAGFGDMIAKYIGLVDWKLSNLISGEYYCDYIASMTREAVDGLCAMADRVTQNDEATAGRIMELLIFTGVAMQFAGNSRPASGAEHIVSHFWETKLLAEGKQSDFHGKKVGVATVAMNRLYHELAKKESITAHKDCPDWNDIRAAYGEVLSDEMMKMNLPDTITSTIEPRVIEENWGKIRSLINDILPDDEKLLDVMHSAGAVTDYRDVHLTRELYEQGLKYHPYMRRRITMTRILPMLDGAEELLKCLKS